MYKLWPDKSIKAERIKTGRVPALVIRSAPNRQKAPENAKALGILWIHGGGYFLGMKEMVYMSRAIAVFRKTGETPERITKRSR